MNPAGKPTAVRHRVGQCPACRDYLFAEVDVIALLDNPRLDVEGKPSVYARAECVAMRLSHECKSDDDTTT